MADIIKIQPTIKFLTAQPRVIRKISPTIKFFKIAGIPGDSIGPIVTNVTPPANTELLPADVLSFDATDETALKKVIVMAKFSGNAIWEVIYDGTRFAPIYDAGSTVAVIANGFHFDMQRLSGWSSRPEILIIAFDGGGNEAVN